MSRKITTMKSWNPEIDKKDTNPRRQYARDFSKIPSGLVTQTKKAEAWKALKEEQKNG